MKNLNPLQLAEYDVAHKIHEEPVFNWWVMKLLHKRDQIINKVATCFQKGTAKFGIEIPTDVLSAYCLDKQNGNTFWKEAISKE